MLQHQQWAGSSSLARGASALHAAAARAVDDGPREHTQAALANNRFSAWQLALGTAHAAEELALGAGAPRLAHVLQWLPSLGPYADAASAPSFVGYHDQAYALVALTHALTDYGAQRCGSNATALAGELRALNATLSATLEDGDSAMAAAAADALLLCGGGGGGDDDGDGASPALVERSEAAPAGGVGPPPLPPHEHADAVRVALDHLFASQRARRRLGTDDGARPDHMHATPVAASRWWRPDSWLVCYEGFIIKST